MTVTPEQAQMLATLAIACRPNGARQWQPDAVMAEIAKIRDRSLGSVILATVRAAMDRNAQRPEVISSGGSHWGDTMLTTDWVPNAVPRESRCSVCSLSETACRIRWAHDHDFESVATANARKANADPESVVTAVEALKDGIVPADPKPAPKGLEDYADRNPNVRARVDTLRAKVPGLVAPPMQEETQEEPA